MPGVPLSRPRNSRQAAPQGPPLMKKRNSEHTLRSRAAGRLGSQPVDLGLWDAVSMWLSGQKLEDFSMWGLPMLWWARTGKLLQFTGGMVVIVDLLGPEWFWKQARRLRPAAERFWGTKPWQVVVRSLLFAALALLVVAAVGYFAGWLGEGSARRFMVLGAFSGLLASAVIGLSTLAVLIALTIPWGQRHHAARWLAFILVCAGFSLTCWRRKPAVGR
jgi:hypothetical protein